MEVEFGEHPARGLLAELAGQAELLEHLCIVREDGLTVFERLRDES